MIPAVDAYVADALGMGPRLARLPITESGCAGGVVGLARARDFLAAHPDRIALVLALEFASLTFQRGDRSADQRRLHRDLRRRRRGGGAGGGRASPRRRRAAARVVAAESVFFPGTTHLMGFHLRNSGLQIILDKAPGPVRAARGGERRGRLPRSRRG